ncbi:MAG: hypothetical protein COT84_00645 [Chlamydiae bacterium CG10_big_fil_rev_8_21_14_0_10_35_9]|nr:MAG: hypothetical protein COT84_00645 [Chlamydiae bacterium CG10_big_fil_rev_8_21_14_0_10_35_9]
MNNDNPDIPFSLTSSDMIHEGFLSFRVDRLEKKGHESVLYHVVMTKTDAVAIVALDTENKYILNKEYRHPLQKVILGCPGGRIEKNEDPITAAKRELLEETGYTCDQWKILGSSFPFPSVCEQKIYYVLATGAKKVASPKMDPFESIQTVALEEKEVLQRINENEDVDGILCSALFLYKTF